MNMELVQWTFNGVEIPMIELETVLYTTTPCLAGALQATEGRLRKIYARRKKLFDATQPGRETNCRPLVREFFKNHKQEFQLKRQIHPDMLLWTVRDIVRLCSFLRSPIALKMQGEIVGLVEAHATKKMVSKEEFLKMVEEKTKIADELAQLKAYKISTDRLKDPMNQQASNLGKLLQMQKATKPFRTNTPIQGLL